MATLAWLLSTYEQLMFHRNCNWMIGFCFVLLPPIQGDSFAANLARCDITGSSNRKEPFTLTYGLSRHYVDGVSPCRHFFHRAPVEVIRAASVCSGDDSPFYLAKEWQDECLFQFPWLECADKISIAKKGAALSQETVVISVRDKELILQRAQKGDPDALNLLFESCRGRLFAHALRILPRRQDAEDAVQDAMLAAFTHLDEFQGRADFLTWATRIVINAALLQIRKARSKPVISWDQVNAEFEESFSSEFLEDQKPTPEEMYLQVEHGRLLEEALWQLPADHRRAIQHCKLTDCSLKEAARALGVPTSTLKARLHRGRRSLLSRFKGKTQHRRENSRNKEALPPCLTAEQSLRAA